MKVPSWTRKDNQQKSLLLKVFYLKISLALSVHGTAKTILLWEDHPALVHSVSQMVTENLRETLRLSPSLESLDLFEERLKIAGIEETTLMSEDASLCPSWPSPPLTILPTSFLSEILELEVTADIAEATKPKSSPLVNSLQLRSPLTNSQTIGKPRPVRLSTPAAITLVSALIRTLSMTCLPSASGQKVFLVNLASK